MLGLLWLIPAAPLAGFLVLALAGRRMRPGMSGAVGAGSAGVSALVAILVAASFLSSPPAGGSFTQTLWTWMPVGDFRPNIAFYLDPLSLVMTLVVSFVGFVIHFYSVEFMRGDEGYSRFFAYMNLFLASMLILVLADNLVLLYLGWEGVGLCSFLLIGFWYKDPANGRAARKAFIVTRVGDAAFAVGLFLLYSNLGVLEIQPLMQQVVQQWPVNSTLAVTAAALLLGGAIGKSGQIPLQTWLPDAMAGPTPTSALIHAATMVTAGVYLIARTHSLFSIAPPVQLAVAMIGAATLLLAGFSALVQRDIKRVLAYSTLSQIGFMFLALGVGAWPAAIYHLVSHAFFKSLLFLGAGVIILRLHHEHDLFKMGGLRSAVPFTFWVFLIGCMALAGLPPTDGFASKGLILSLTWSSPTGGRWLWAAGLLGTFLTSIYTFRLLFLAFYGPESGKRVPDAGRTMGLPLLILAFLTVGVAVLNWPGFLGGKPFFTAFVEGSSEGTVEAAGAGWLELALLVVTLAGIPLAWRMAATARTAPVSAVQRFWLSGWGFDWFYDRIFVRPFVWVARLNRDDFIDFIYGAIGGTAEILHYGLKLMQTGRMRWYAMGMTAGAVAIVALILFL